MTPTTHNPFKYHHLMALGLVLFSFFMALLVNRTVFERLPHLEDELAYIYQARIFARGDVVIDIPEPRRAYWQPFVVDYAESGKRFGKYAPGWPLLLSFGVHLGALWIVNALFAAATVAIVYRLGREVFDPDVGVMAAALTAFSPMLLLLNASYMSHTSALTLLMLFIYAYWRIERGKQATRWGIVAGIALGLLAINRPLTAIGGATPFIIWSGLKVLREFFANVQNPLALVPTLRPFVILAVIASIIATGLPLFNAAATNDPGQNLYTLVWEYDRIGFGLCCGRSSITGGEGHTIVKGVRHTRFDLSLMAADLFGWQSAPITEADQEHLRTSSAWWTAVGWSFFLLPIGLLFGFRRWWLRLWSILGVLWLAVPLYFDMDFIKSNSEAIWVWLAAWFFLLVIPPIVIVAFRDLSKPSTETDHHSRWTWLLLGVIIGIIGIQLAYWIGSQRYSTRYYSESVAAFALISALPIAWLARRISRRAIYGVFAVVMLWSLYTYSTPRIDALYRFNLISPEQRQQVEARAEGDAPILVLISGETGDVRWRSFGSLMAITSPYLDSDIVAAWDYSNGGDVRQQLLAKYPDRQVIEMGASGNDWWFIDTPTVVEDNAGQSNESSPPVDSSLPPPFAESTPPGS